MSVPLATRLAGALQRFDRRVWPAHRVVLSERTQAELRKAPLLVADVGAASGPEELWQPLDGLVHFLTFEPAPREPGASAAPAAIKATSFPIGLSAQKGRGVLRLMRDPDASTLCEANRLVLDAFVIGDGLQEVGRTEIDLDTLDGCLQATPELRPDFLKVDVEGADLDVLRGASSALAATVLGVRVEVSFLERHRGTPFFGETDAFLRGLGFQLFHLSRERWIRRNLTHGYTSLPQLAWGDAVYFLTAKQFRERLTQMPAPGRERTLAKMVAILLTHGVHDYALELVETAAAAGWLTAERRAELSKGIQSSVDRTTLYLGKALLGVGFALAIYVMAFPLKSTRQRASFYVQQRAGHFCRILTRMAGRSGPQRSCISD